MTTRHFLDIKDHSPETLRGMIDNAVRMKALQKAGKGERPLVGKTLAMIFERPSTRTRVSFDVGMRQLGGEPLMLTGQEMQLGRGESLPDTARVLSRYVDAVMIRLLNHEDVLELAANASVPIINGLTKKSHPCQVMADILTFEEHRGRINGKTITWVGDANNVFTSLVHAAGKFNFTIRCAAPEELQPTAELIAWARKEGVRLTITDNPQEAAAGADAIIADTWVSMGDTGAEERHELLMPYQVNAALMALAAPKAVFMHCLPAHRGEEVTEDVIDGPQSVVFDEAENRLHAQKAVLCWCLGV